MFQTPGHRGTCPACGGSFVLSPERPRGAERVRKATCSRCGNAAVVSNTWIARLLVVAGTDELRAGVRSMLASAGHEVTEAGDVASALRSYRESPADVVIVDLSAPGKMDGQAVIRGLRAEFPNAKAVAMSPRTSYGVADPLAAARQLGAVRILRMPFSANDLLGVVGEARREATLV
jgi:CheY-like chemotaxis protein